MTKTKPVLGRGLASLIPKPVVAAPVLTVRPDDGSSNDVISQIELDKIQTNPFQPRADFDQVALDELKRSIQEKGVIQAITVRRLDGGGYQLISGERRVRSAREAGLTHIPAYIIKVGTNEEMLELALIENLQREHLNPIEIAISYKRLIDECAYTQEQLADKISKDRSTIANFLRLLKLPEPIQGGVRKGLVSNGHARALITIEDPVLQLEIFHEIVNHDLSVRDVERLVRKRGRKKTQRTRVPASSGNVSLTSVEDRLRQILGTRVEVKPLADGKGHIVIDYYSDDDLDRLIDLLSTTDNRNG